MSLRSMSHPTSRLAALAIAAAMVLGACSAEVSFGEGEVPTNELETQVSSALADQVGVAPDTVTCPDPLPEKAGSEVRCELSVDGVRLGLTVTSNGESTTKPGTVDFDVAVDDEPISD